MSHPGTRRLDTNDRVRRDRIDTNGAVSLRHGGKLYHIGVGPTYAGTHILLLAQDLHIRIIDAATAELLRELTLDPTATTSQPANPKDAPHPDPKAKTPNPDVGSGSFRCPERSHTAEGVGFEPTVTRQRHSGFQDRRPRPLGEPSRRQR